MCLGLRGPPPAEGWPATSRVAATRVLDGLHGFFSLKKVQRPTEGVFRPPGEARQGKEGGAYKEYLGLRGPQCGWGAPRGG